jgi:xylulokinase
MQKQKKDLIIAYDLGTGGIKASLFDLDGNSCCDTFSQYDVVYTGSDFHEQAPDVWFDGICSATQLLLQKCGAAPSSIVALSISGHSLGVVPVDSSGRLLRRMTPIWSDTRSKKQTEAFFEKVPYANWYIKTGNGFPAECYSVFKIMWYRDNEPELYANTYKILGSKDYCNFRLTGVMATDHSYASGSGVYDLLKNDYDEDYIRASGVRRDLLPNILRSHDVIGTLTSQAAEKLGLTTAVKVVAGGVDNSCMAMGARGIENGRAYISLGSSSWIAVVSDKPLVDAQKKPFVFAHVIDGMYASATSIFAAGSSLRWVRDVLCPDLVEKEKDGLIPDAYIAMNELAAQSPIGAGGLQFNPSLAGGAMIEQSKNIVGAFVGLQLSHTRSDIVRAAQEGITYNLWYAMTVLESCGITIPELLMVGGGAKSPFWRQMFADIFGMKMIKTNVDQNAASLGAAALAAYGLGFWSDYTPIDKVHKPESTEQPNHENTARYRQHYALSRYIAGWLAQTGDKIDSGRL